MMMRMMMIFMMSMALSTLTYGEKLYASREVLKTSGDEPLPRQGHTAMRVGSTEEILYFGGQIEPNHRCFNDLVSFNATSSTFSEISSGSGKPPAPRAHHTATLVQGKMFVFGGVSFYEVNGADSSTWRNDLSLFDTETRSWTEGAVSSEKQPSPRQGHTATLVGSKLLVFGGFSDEGMASSELWALDVSPSAEDGSYSWSKMDIGGDAPSPRQGHSAALLDGKYYVIYGGYGVGFSTLRDIHVVDLSAKTPMWSIVRSNHEEERGHGNWEGTSATRLRGAETGSLVIVGGCEFPGRKCKQGEHVVSVLGHDGEDWTWRNLEWKSKYEDLSRFGHTATVLPGELNTTIIVFGGCQLDRVCYNDVIRLVVSSVEDSVPEIEDEEQEISSVDDESSAVDETAEETQQQEDLEAAMESDPEVQDIADRIEAAKADGTLDEVMEDIREKNPDQLKWAEIAAGQEEKKKEEEQHEEEEKKKEEEQQEEEEEEKKREEEQQEKDIQEEEEEEKRHEEGTSNEQPTEMTCPLMCSGKGTCKGQICTCRENYYGAACEYKFHECIVEIEVPETASTPKGKLRVPAKDRRYDTVIARPNGVDKTMNVIVPTGIVPLSVPVAQSNGTLHADKVYILERAEDNALELRTRVRPLVQTKLAMPAIRGDNTITVYTPFDKLAKGSALIVGDGVVQIKAEGIKASEKTMRFQLSSPVRDAAPRNSPVYLSKISPPPLPLPLTECTPEELEDQECKCNKFGGICTHRYDKDGHQPKCECFAGWGDPTCSTALCPNNCTHPIFGTCTNEQQEYGSNCKCEYGYKGKACDQHTGCGDLGRNCDENAYCVETTFSVQTEDEGAFLDIVTGECRCFAGWAGSRCDHAVCPNNCTSEKHGICGLDDTGRTQKCLCKDHHVGLDCSRSEFCHLGCSHHGVCDKSTGTCTCDAGWVGDGCETLSKCESLNKCSGNGHCHAGRCLCFAGFTSDDCSEPVACPGDCSEAGVCIRGKCHCERGRTGPDCASVDSRFCKDNCNERGVCSLGKCVCDVGYEGESCETITACPTSGPDNLPCGGTNGVCDLGRCFCGPSYTGPACEPTNPCPRAENGRECGGNGLCHDSKCYCQEGWYGAACQRGSECEHECSRNSICFNGKCLCDIGWSGPTCSTPEPCPMGIDPEETSSSSFLEIATSTKRKYTNIAEHGRNVTKPKPQGPKPQPCSNHGRCIRGNCYCEPGFSGSACNVSKTCSKVCELHGTCEGDVCICDEGFRGLDCSEPIPCPNDCGGHGICMLGTCACRQGYIGRACETHLPCPNDCLGRGECVAGKCVCDQDFHGVDCSRGGSSQHKCRAVKPGGSTSCSGHGECTPSGVCVCERGYGSADCSVEIPCAMNCSGHGLCSRTDCFCDPGYTGHACQIEQACPTGPSADEEFDGFGEHVRGLDPEGPICSGHGACAYGRCFCLGEYYGEACERSKLEDEQFRRANESCPIGAFSKMCSGHGSCMDSQCSCEEEWFGRDCSQNTADGKCPNECSSKGVCSETTGKCACMSGWTGIDCSKRSEKELKKVLKECAESCSSHGVCVEGKCECSAGWEGTRCDLQTCPNLCTVRDDGSSQGDCIDGRCICSAGYGGDDCSIACPNLCSGHGTCFGQVTLVNSSDVERVHEHVYDDNEEYEIPVRESKSGIGEGMVRRHSFSCMCIPGFTGEDCSMIATIANTVAAGHGITGDLGDRHVEQSSITSSIVLVAIATFAVGLCVVPVVKLMIDRRASRISKQIIEKESQIEQFILA